MFCSCNSKKTPQRKVQLPALFIAFAKRFVCGSRSVFYPTGKILVAKSNMMSSLTTILLLSVYSIGAFVVDPSRCSASSPIGNSARYASALSSTTASSLQDTPVVLPEFANAAEYLAYMETVAKLPAGFAVGTADGTFVSQEAPDLGKLPIRGTILHLTNGPTDNWAAVYTQNKVSKEYLEAHRNMVGSFYDTCSFIHSFIHLLMPVSRRPRDCRQGPVGQRRTAASHCHQQQSFERVLRWGWRCRFRTSLRGRGQGAQVTRWSRVRLAVVDGCHWLAAAGRSFGGEHRA
jgi:hypothetical protein